MISYISEKIAIQIKEQSNHESSVIVLKYALEKILNAVFILSLGVLCGWALGQIKEVLFVLMTFAILRIFSGGYHFSSGTTCVVVSVAVANIIPIVTPYTNEYTMLINIITVVLVAFLAPTKNIENKSNIPKKYYPLLKLISIIIVIINLVVVSSLLAVTFFIQAISLIPITRR